MLAEMAGLTGFEKDIQISNLRKYPSVTPHLFGMVWLAFYRPQ